jgi:thiol-disulfide isomerase/thioredoxin
MTRDTLYSIFATVLLAASASLNVLQVYRSRDLAAALEKRSPAGTLKVGEAVRPLSVTDAEGRTVEIGGSGDSARRATVVYVFSPECGWCKRNAASIEKLARSAAGKYRFVAVSLAPVSPAQYEEARKLGFPVITELPAEIAAAYKFQSTPETVVISPQSKVVKVWLGAYLGETRKDVEKFFSVSLPDLETPRGAEPIRTE